MGWIRGDIAKRENADEVFEAWLDLMEEIPERAIEANELSDFGFVESRKKGEELLLAKEEKIVGMGFVEVRDGKPFYLTLTNAYTG